MLENLKLILTEILHICISRNNVLQTMIIISAFKKIYIYSDTHIGNEGIVFLNV